MSGWRRWVWLALALACLGCLALIIERNAARGRFTKAFSTYGSGPEGTRGLYLLLGELGYRTARWSQDLARVPAGATLIALGACDSGSVRALSRYERDDLDAWVKRGGLLVVAGARNYLPNALSVAFDDDRRCRLRAESESRAPRLPRSVPPPEPGQPHTAPDEVLEALSEIAREQSEGLDDDAESREVLAIPLGGALKGMPFVPFRRPGQLLAEEALEFQSLLVGPDAGSRTSTEVTPLGLTYTHGRGRVIVLSAANMFQNAELLDSEGATLFTRLLRAYAPSELVIFDEYHLGLGERRSLMQYLRQAGTYPLFGQLFLIAAVVLWRAGARMGALRAASGADPQFGTAAFVGALGRLYARVGDRRAAIRLIARAALSRIAQHYALAHVPLRALAHELSARGAVRAAEHVERIASIGSQPGDETLVASVARIDAACAAARGTPQPARRTHTT